MGTMVDGTPGTKRGKGARDDFPWLTWIDRTLPFWQFAMASLCERSLPLNHEDLRNG